MILNSKTIRQILKEQWPFLANVWLLDKHFLQMEYDRLCEVVREISVKEMQFIEDVWDCDNYALQLQAKMQKYQYELALNDHNKTDEETVCQWAFGQVIGTKINGNRKVHSCNIALTDKGIALIEPQTDFVWLAESSDEVFFVKF